MDPPAKQAKAQGRQDMTKSLREPRAEVQPCPPKPSNEAFSKIIYFRVEYLLRCFWSSFVVTLTEGALCQLVTLISRLPTGKTWIIGKHFGLVQSKDYL